MYWAPRHHQSGMAFNSRSFGSAWPVLLPFLLDLQLCYHRTSLLLFPCVPFSNGKKHVGEIPYRDKSTIRSGSPNKRRCAPFYAFVSLLRLLSVLALFIIGGPGCPLILTRLPALIAVHSSASRSPACALCLSVLLAKLLKCRSSAPVLIAV